MSAPVISLSAEALFYWGSLPITNTLVVSLVISAFLIIFSIIMSFNIKDKPGPVQNALEFLFSGAIDFIDSIVQDRRQAYAFFPLVFTFFIFIILSNWIELVPGLGSIGIWGVHHGEEVIIPFIRSASADMNITLALAIFSLFSIHSYGIMSQGFLAHAGKYFVSPFKEPYVIGTFVGLLEIVSEFAKIISFSFRLFGNIFAGEVILLVIAFLMPYFAPLPFLFLEILVGFIQALVFSMLTLIFLKGATQAHH